MSRLTDEQIDRIASEVTGALHSEWHPTEPNEWRRMFARAIERALVQPPDGTTERRKLLTHDLASMLVFGGFMPADAQDDPEGYDNCRTMEKVGYLCDLINGRMSEAVCAEPSMSTTSPPDGSLSSGSGASGECVQAPEGGTEPVAASGSFMTREQATAFMRNYLKREPTEQQIAACVDAYLALFGDTVSADWMEPGKTEALTRILNIATDEKRGWSHWDLVATICRAALAGRAENSGTDERERFEKWAIRFLGDRVTWRETGDCELAWQAWKAAQSIEGVAKP